MSAESIKHKIGGYKKKFYRKELFRGFLLTFITSLSLALLVVLLENNFWFSGNIRFILLIFLLLVFLVILTRTVILPGLKYLNVSQPKTDLEASREIGFHFPEIKDKLVNYLQISQLDTKKESLVAAAIQQKTEELNIFKFEKAVDFSPLRKYVYGFLAVVGALLILSFINLPILTESSKRIILYNQEFKRKAPFEFILMNEKLEAFKNESFNLKVKIDGEQIPESAYIKLDDRRIKLSKNGENVYSFLFNNIHQDINFEFEAAGFLSDPYQLHLLQRPELRSFMIDLDYPQYTGIKDESIQNSGNLIIPEGTTISWNINAFNTHTALLKIDKQEYKFNEGNDDQFTFIQQAREPFEYQIDLKNDDGNNKSRISYFVDIIKDQYPKLELEYYPDTISYRSISLAGSVQDDYGITKTSLYYRTNFDQSFKPIHLDKNGKNDQQFFFTWPIDTLHISPEQTLEFYVSVRDNDRVNGPKETRSQKFYFKKPNKKELDELLSDMSQQAENQIHKSKKEAESLNDKIKELEERLKTRNEFEWQEEKIANEILDKRKDLEKSIEALQKEFEALKENKNEFNDQSERIQKKTEQLHELMNELLDEKTKKLYDELQKLLNEKLTSEQLLNQINKIDQGEKNLEKELERALELFKRLKMESLLEQSTKDLEELSKKQQNLSHEDSAPDELSNDQNQLKEDFEEITEKIDEIQKMNQELKKPEPMKDFDGDQEQIQKNLEELSEKLNQNRKPNQKTRDQQQNTSEQMKALSEKMSEMQSNMEMTMIQENIDNLRNILDNLVKLSFDEEDLIDNFKSVSQTDPRFIELSQEQLQLIDNAQVIEDSLYALAERVFQISGFLTKEISAINENLDKAIYELRERNKVKATSHQQFAMTSINNLALLLSDVLEQMQQSMSNSSSAQPDDQQMSLSQLQKQLSQQIEDLKKGNKSGRQLSEELARLAAEQERIRQQLQQMQEKLNGQPDGKKIGDNLSEILEEMEKNEVDLVNKRLTQQLVERQKKIVTKMLEAEESIREQKIDPEREGQTADKYKRQWPPAYEEYLKARKSEIELLKSVPIELKPFYKKEVNDYFRRLSEEENK